MEKEKLEKRLSDIENSNLELTLFEHTLNGISECLSITDFENNILFANKAFVETYGYGRDEILGCNISIISSSQNDPGINKLVLEQTLQGGWEGELYNTKKDGSEFLISLKTSVIKNEKGEPIALIGAARDLSDEMKTRLELQEAENKYRSLFMELKDTVFESTPEGKLIDINPAGLELFGYNSIEELLSANISNDLYADAKDRQKFLDELEKSGFVKGHVVNYKKRNGETGIVLETAFAVKDENGRIVSYRGILRDITDLKKTEAELKNLNASKDKFFSIIAHDLRSPFGSLLSFSEFLMEDIDELTKDEIKLFASKINESSKAVFELLNNLLQWSRIQTGRMDYLPENYNLRSLAEQNINIFRDNAKSKHIEIINEIKSEIVIFADENMLNSILRNLISNAVKFTNAGGKVVLSAEIKKEFVEINVTDTGIGISDEIINQLFQIDVHLTTPGTASEEGTGLGLILCKEMVNINGGEIRVKSSLGNGTTFTFTLPAVR